MTLRERLNEARSKAPPMHEGGRRQLGVIPPKTPQFERWMKETFDVVQVVPIIEHPDIPDDAPLRRFMDLPKALDLLVNRRLVLPKLAQLKKCDPRECDARPDYSRETREQLERRVIELKEFSPDSEHKGDPYYGIGLVLGQPSMHVTFEEKVKQMSLKDLKQAAWFLEHERLKQDLACSCWYGSSMESDAMWKLYCQHVGVAITTSVSRLKASVKCFVPKVLSADLRLSLARIHYEDTDSCKDIPPWLIKRTAFKHEDEVRLYIDYPYVRPPGFELIVDPRHLIEEIIVTPYAEKWQSEVIEATIDRLLRAPQRRIGVKKPIVKQSTHMNESTPSWPKSEASLLFAALSQSWKSDS